MSLRLVYGRAGSGKTRFCLESIKDSINNSRSKIVLIVPEQFSLQAEKNLIRAAGKGGMMQAEVLSFRRMAYRVFNEVGGIARRHINNAGKSMILFRIMDRLKDELCVFSSAARQKGFANTMSKMIAEFKRYDLSPEILKETSAGLDETSGLRHKLQDLSLIYTEFEAAIHHKYMDSDDDLTELCKKLDKSEQFNNTEIWIDEFTGFTPQEFKVIQKLLDKSERVNICLCTDCLETDLDTIPGLVFAPVRNTADKLKKLAQQANVNIELPIRLGQYGSGSCARPGRFCSNKALGHLEQNLFSYPCRKYGTPAESISVFAAANMFSEVESAAREVIKLCRETGLRYRDIAVTCRNLDNYEKVVSVIFKEYDIPCFVDKKRDITGHPLVILILSVFDIFKSNWSYESVFRYVKSGMSNIDRESSDVLENYVLACGIKGNKWTQEQEWLARVEYGFDKKGMDSYEQQSMETVNRARIQLAQPLSAFRKKTGGRRNATEICTALFEFLCDIGVPQRIEGLIQHFSVLGELGKVVEYRQVWNIVMEVLTQVVEVTGEDVLGIGRFSEILAAGFEEYSIGLIPPALDQVLVGSIERSKSHEIKALFILGVNEGVFPASVNEEGILTDAERIRLDSLGLQLAKDSKYKLLEERFLVYTSLATPSEYLRLSYPAADRDGKALRPSRLISDIKRIFPMLRESSDITGINTGESEIELIAAPGPAFNELTAMVRKRFEGYGTGVLWPQVFRWFQNDSFWAERCTVMLAGLGYSNQPSQMEVNRALSLYGSPINTSISRLEAYSSCPFSYYVKYGLKAEERMVFRLNPVDVGTFMHNVIDEFSRLIAGKSISWRTLEKEWCMEQVSSIIDGMLGKASGTVFNSSKKYVYLTGRLKRIVTRSVLTISEHMKRSGFEPVGYEVEFSEYGQYPPIDIELPSGDRLSLTGRIDRIDSMTNEDGTYLRIIDYKSGNKALKLADVYYGLQLQLLTYMDAVLGNEKGKKLLPGGVLYFRLDDPIIKGDRLNTREDIEKAIMKQLRMKGLLLADVRLVREMDRQIDGDSLIIPARLNKGDILGRSSAATEEQFGVLRKHVRKTLMNIGEEILRGNVKISPYKKRTVTACTYCSYTSVCQFDPAVADNNYRFLPDIKDEDVWSYMHGDSVRSGREEIKV